MQNTINRRRFIATAGAAVSSTLLCSKLIAKDTSNENSVIMGMLIDTTRCVGCGTCEVVCAEVNGLPDPSNSIEAIGKKIRATSETQWTVVNRFETDNGEVFVKKQCMHCTQAACATACLTKAMHKTENGPVAWDGSKCMGCRFCMISCPFDVPKFEYNSANPNIHKCMMCWKRIKQKELPACVENCPAEALLFGPRNDLLNEAKKRIYTNPEMYITHIYGENEVGGTGVLYLSNAPFEKLGFRTDLGKTPYPEFTKEFLYAVPVVLTLFPAFLLAINNSTRNEQHLIGKGNGHAN